MYDLQSPQVGMRKGEDGIWYWFVNGRQLLKGGQRIKVLPAENLPLLKYKRSGIGGLSWQISCDGGNAWENVENADTGRETPLGIDVEMRNYGVPKGVCFVFGDNMSDKENNIVIPYPKLKIKVDENAIVFKKSGEVRTVRYILSEVMDKAMLDAEVPNGWQVSIAPETSTTGTITITAPETIVETTITITAKEADRTATCELKCGKPMFYLPQKEFKVGYEGENLSVQVKTNLNFSVKIPDEASAWIEWVAEETTYEKIALRVSENEDAFSRDDATILCLDDEGVILDKFSVSQTWNENKIFEVRISDAGGLREYINSKRMTNVRNLKISGLLNANDFVFLGKMLRLRYLDVSDVKTSSFLVGCFKTSSCATFVLPKTWTMIPDECFRECKSIENVFIPASCETIGVSAFEYCSKLSSVSFESGSCLKTISSSAFHMCSSLVTIKIPASVISIGDYGLGGCHSLANLSFEPGSRLQSVGKSGFGGCGLLHRIDMRNCTKLETIGSKAFYGGDNQIYSFQIGAVVPPSCQADTFGNVGEYSVLKVPSGSEDAYKAASGWSGFYKIIADE